MRIMLLDQGGLDEVSKLYGLMRDENHKQVLKVENSSILQQHSECTQNLKRTSKWID